MNANSQRWSCPNQTTPENPRVVQLRTWAKRLRRFKKIKNSSLRDARHHVAPVGVTETSRSQIHSSGPAQVSSAVRSADGLVRSGSMAA